MGDWLDFGVDMELMELRHLGEGLLVFAFSFVFVTGACFGTSITLGAGWTVLPCGCVRSLCAARLSVSPFIWADRLLEHSALNHVRKSRVSVTPDTKYVFY